jgi:hypothetical protein
MTTESVGVCSLSCERRYESGVSSDDSSFADRDISAPVVDSLVAMIPQAERVQSPR